jgi:hypothetical protein
MNVVPLKMNTSGQEVPLKPYGFVSSEPRESVELPSLICRAARVEWFEEVGGWVRRRWHSVFEGTQKEPAQYGCNMPISGLDKCVCVHGHGTYGSLTRDTAVLGGCGVCDEFVGHGPACCGAVDDAVEDERFAGCALDGIYWLESVESSSQARFEHHLPMLFG